MTTPKPEPRSRPNASARKSEPVDIVDSCRRLHTAIDRLDELVARTAGVSRSDLRCLNLLEFGPLPATAIARQLNMATGSVTALIDRLEAKGLVGRLREAEDRRVVTIQATPKVFEVIGPIYLGFANRLRKRVDAYSPSGRRLAVKHLSDVAEICEQEVTERSQVESVGVDEARAHEMPKAIVPGEGLALVIYVDESFYFKPDAGQLLLSPANEDPVEPCDVVPDDLDVAIAVDRFETATTIAVRKLNHRWAGLRSFVADRSPVGGFDVRAPGFFWLAGREVTDFRWRQRSRA